jgi:hypothetical protein
MYKNKIQTNMGRQYTDEFSGSGMGVDMDWIDLAQEWDRWRALANTVMNLRVPQNAGNFLSS